MSNGNNDVYDPDGKPFRPQNTPGLNRLLDTFSRVTHPEVYTCNHCDHEEAPCPKELIEKGQTGRVKILVNGCVDARGAPHAIFRLRAGQVALTQSAGAYITPHEEPHGSTQTWESIEYFVHHIHVKGILQTAHTECGKIAANIAGVHERLPENSHLRRQLEHLTPVVQRAKQMFEKQHGRSPSHAELGLAAEFEVVRASVGNVNAYLAKYAPDAGVQVHGWLYDMKGANILALQPDGSFEPITFLPKREEIAHNVPLHERSCQTRRHDKGATEHPLVQHHNKLRMELN